MCRCLLIKLCLRCWILSSALLGEDGALGQAGLNCFSTWFHVSKHISQWMICAVLPLIQRDICRHTYLTWALHHSLPPITTLHEWSWNQAPLLSTDVDAVCFLPLVICSVWAPHLLSVCPFCFLISVSELCGVWISGVVRENLCCKCCSLN